MRKIMLFACLVLASLPVFAQASRPVNLMPTCTSTSGSCPSQNYFCLDSSNYLWRCRNNIWTVINREPVSGTSCAAYTADGQPCWDTDDDVWYVGNGTAALAMMTSATDPTFTGTAATFQDMRIDMDVNQMMWWPDANGTDVARYGIGQYRSSTFWHPQNELHENMAFCWNCDPTNPSAVHDSTTHHAKMAFENVWNQVPSTQGACTGANGGCEEVWEWNLNIRNSTNDGYFAGGSWRTFDYAVFVNWNGASTNDGPEANSTTVLEDSNRSGLSAFNRFAQTADCSDVLEEIVNVTDNASCVVTGCTANSVTCAAGLSGGHQFNDGDVYEVSRWPRAYWAFDAYDPAADPTGISHLLIDTSTGFLQAGRGLEISSSTDANDAGDTTEFPQGFAAINVNYTFTGDWEEGGVRTGSVMSGVNSNVTIPAGASQDLGRVAALYGTTNMGAINVASRDVTTLTAQTLDLNWGSAQNVTVATAYILDLLQGGAYNANNAVSGEYGGIRIAAPVAGLVGEPVSYAAISIQDTRNAGATNSDAIRISAQSSNASATKGGIRFATDDSWNAGHLQFGATTGGASTLHIWGDNTVTPATLRGKGGTPASESDGVGFLFKRYWMKAASCNNVTATTTLDLFTSNVPAAACVTGSNTTKGVLDYDDTTDEAAQFTMMLPADWQGAIDVDYKWFAAATTGSVGWCTQVVCVADAETDDPAFVAQGAANCVSDAAKGTTNQTNDATDTAITVTGCAAGELAHFAISRDANGGAVTDDMTGDARLIGVLVTLR